MKERQKLKVGMSNDFEVELLIENLLLKQQRSVSGREVATDDPFANKIFIITLGLSCE